jgi:tRNA(fMet)-specific endonuclease VapC
VTLGELLVGAYKSSQPAANLALVHQLVHQFLCLPYEEKSADHYGRVRSDLERIGQIIGPYDLQIAAIALNHQLALVTHNVNEFSRVPGLALEDWQVP